MVLAVRDLQVLVWWARLVRVSLSFLFYLIPASRCFCIVSLWGSQ
jgi:hypothetical protein